MKIGFYSSLPLDNKRNWSGTMFKMYEQIVELGYEIEWIPQQKLTDKESARLEKIRHFFYRIFRRGYNTKVNIFSSWILGKKISKILKESSYDIIFVPTYLNDFAFVNTNIPIVYLNDANVGQLLNYYPYYSGFGLVSKLETQYIEKRMLNNANINIFSSEWAANYAIGNYKINPEKISILKFGANLIVQNQWSYHKDVNGEIVFLFLAVDWERKRGKLAYDSIKILKEKGYPVKMQIIGCNPGISDYWVDVIPFLDKNKPHDLQEIQNHLIKAHFLFVPTQADCTPIAFCEAAGYGLPIISTDTGGVSAHVENHTTGLLLPQHANANDYANEIEKILKNPELIESMSFASRKKYEKELNWEKWKKDFKYLINML